MKKLLLASSMVLLLAGSAFAASGDLGDKLEAAALSSGVSGSYYCNSAQSAFAISTYNSKGSKKYATGSFTTNIYVNDCAADPCAAADLIADPGADANFAESTLDSFGDVLGGS